MDQSAITDRLDERIRHFDRLADKFRNWFMFLKSTQILFVISIPVAAVAIPSDWLRGVNAALGALVIGIETFLQTFKVQHYSMTWRGTQRKLQYEKHLHANHAGPYKQLVSQENADVLLVERVEDYLLQEEYPDWRQITETLGRQDVTKSK